MKLYVCLTLSLIVFQLFIGQILGDDGGNGGYVAINGSQIGETVAQEGEGPIGEDGKPGIADCGEDCVINERRQEGRFRRKRATVVYNAPCSDYHCIIYITKPDAYAPCSAHVCDYRIQ